MKKPSGLPRRFVTLCAALIAPVGCTSGVVDSSPIPPVNSGGASAMGTSGTAGTAGTSVPGVVGAGAGGSGSVVSAVPPPFQPAPGMLRRLTRAQFKGAISDVFGVAVDVTTLDDDSWDGDFATIGAASVATSPKGAEQYQALVEQAVNTVFDDATKRAKLLGCTPSGKADDTCVRGFIQDVGRRAWRRPLESAEVDRFATLAATAATKLSSAVEGARWATVALFGSPNFLYRPELGALSADGSLRLTGYELASRLSFLLWNSLPDKQLLDDAQNGLLATKDGIRSTVDRLLAAPAGREAVAEFGAQFMRLDRVASQAKDQMLYPAYTPDLQAGMVRDMRDVWASVVLDDQASALELFSTRKVVANSDLAKLYGLDTAGLDSKTFKAFTLPADSPRIGILSKAAFLSQWANQQEGSPTLRGRFIRQSLICQVIPGPPPNVNTMLPDLPEGVAMTKRQRLEIHRANPTCGTCHGLMDPLGLPLESFDAIGRYRTTDDGLPVDPTSTFEDKPIANAPAMGTAMSSSADIAQCIARKYYAYAVGHAERAVDGSVINTLEASFQTSGYKLRDLIVDTVTHDAFASVAPQL
ncbi:MAG: DUF1592 domain-containing protein [Polyangiaceae bacterium]